MTTGICAVCGNKIFRTTIKDEGTFTSPAGTFTHTGRGDEVETWCNEPQPAGAWEVRP